MKAEDLVNRVFEISVLSRQLAIKERRRVIELLPAGDIKDFYQNLSDSDIAIIDRQLIVGPGAEDAVLDALLVENDELLRRMPDLSVEIMSDPLVELGMHQLIELDSDIGAALAGLKELLDGD